MQEFATALVDKFRPSDVASDKAHVVARIKAVLEEKKKRLGSTGKQFLDALVAYWGAVSDLVQRQEHGAQKEGSSLTWEDGRRVVFQTAMIWKSTTLSAVNFSLKPVRPPNTHHPQWGNM